MFNIRNFESNIVCACPVAIEIELNNEKKNIHILL